MGWDTEREEPLPQCCNGLYLPFPPTRTPSPSLQSGCVQAGGVPYHIHCTHSRGFGGLYVCGGRCSSSCTLWCRVGTFKKILSVWQFDGLTYLKMKGLVLTVGFIILGGKETNTTHSDKMTDSYHKCIFRPLRNKSPWLYYCIITLKEWL